ncbi:DUF3180 domain-containing protein [Microbacterium halophytorum]|uniref:DUF3180 domain-containing protein n=1 Tax=Microbacterium halophytorum TaxID=2067568 RepID=UPI000CFA9F52|nr:DUF3180 domain-containing protein [Microbacterium halophytorum]
MKRTEPIALVVAAVLGGGAGYLIDQLLSATGHPTFTPPVGLSIMLVVLGGACIALAWPIRKSVKDAKAPRVDPFRALRVAVLAKASSLVGALVGGVCAGLLVFLASRPVVPPVGSMTAIIAAVGASAALVAAALFAEYMCTLPKDPDDRDQPDAGPGAEPTT